MTPYPMRQKYIDEKVGFYHIFGTSSDDPNLVDVSDGRRDVFTNVPRDVAEEICRLQNEFLRRLYHLMEIK